MNLTIGALSLGILVAGYVLIRTVRHSDKARERARLEEWRKTITYGDKIRVNDGAVIFDAQVTMVWSDRVQVISSDMRVAAYPKEVIYPQE